MKLLHVLLAAAGAAAAAAGSWTQQVRLSYPNDPSAMTIAWTAVGADAPTEGAKAWVWPAGSSPSAAKSFPADTSTYTAGGWAGQLYNVTVPGLQAGGATYSYRVSVGGQTSRNFNFTTAPGPAAPGAPAVTPHVAAVYADMGEASPGPGASNETLAALIAASQAGEFAYHVHAGDIAYTGGVESVWDTYLNEAEAWTSTLPYQVGVGNHEHYFNFSGFRHRFFCGEENQNLWYEWSYGGVRWVALSTEHDFSVGSPQHAWAEATLTAANTPEARAENPWVILYLHRPFYCSTNDYYDCNIFAPTKLRPAFESLLRSADVDFVFAGHLHNYERMYPVYNGKLVQAGYNNPDAPVHIIVGMAGDDEGLTDTWDVKPDYSVVRSATLGYGRLEFHNATAATFQLVLSHNGTVADEFTLLKKHQPGEQ